MMSVYNKNLSSRLLLKTVATSWKSIIHNIASSSVKVVSSESEWEKYAQINYNL